MYKWKLGRLADVAQIFSGFAFKTSDLGENGVPVIKIGNIQKKLVIEKCKDHIDPSLITPRMKRYFLNAEDTLVAMTGAGSVGRVGKMHSVKSSFLVNQRVAIVRPDLNICDPSYIYYALSENSVEERLYGLGLGAGQPNISAAQIGGVEIPLPSMAFQKKISQILSNYDALIDNNSRRIIVLESIALSFYREFFVNYQIPSRADLSFVDSEAGRIPVGWTVLDVKSIAGLISRGPSLSYVESDGVPVVNQKCIRNGEIEMQAIQYAAPLSSRKSHLYLEMYDVLINSMGVGTLGRVSRNLSIQDLTIIHNCITVVRAKPGEPYSAFLYYRLSEQQRHFESLGIGATGQTSLRIETIEDLKVAVPPLEILSKFEEIVIPIWQEIGLLKRMNSNLLETKDLLRPRLLSGQVELMVGE